MVDMFGHAKPAVPKELLATYDAAHRAKFNGVPAPIVGKKDGPNAARLMRLYPDFDQLSSWVPLFFDVPDKFIQESGIVTAMVGILTALRGTKLYHRLEKEKRLLKESSGSNTDFSINFVPKMKYQDLINGYKGIIRTIYSPRHYYQRIINFLKEHKPRVKKKHIFTFII